MKLPYTHIHCIGIGGIHVGAVAKLLAANGAILSGSDAVDHERRPYAERCRNRQFAPHQVNNGPPA